MRANISSISARFVDNFSRVTFPMRLGRWRRDVEGRDDREEDLNVGY